MEHPNYSTIKVKNAVAAIRISSTRQAEQGNSPEDQKEQINRFAKLQGVHIKKYFTFVQSASGDIQPNQEAIDYCKDPKSNVQFFIIKSIDRFTRGGAYFYSELNRQLVRYNVQLLDTYGVISTQRINTLDHLGFKYPWSVFSPTTKSELLEAERAKDDVRDILTRLISAEIRYVQHGYRVRQSPFGYVNKKTETAQGKRIILEPHPTEASLIIRMFELRSQSVKTDEEIVKDLNVLGFKSRRYKVHDPVDKIKTIGYAGEKPLNVKQLQRYIASPIYAGINVEKWTFGKPVKAKFPGLVSIRLFNQANRGKLTIVEDGEDVVIYKGKAPDWRLRKDKNNPLFPYKKYVLCPKCRQNLLGSAPRSKSGKHIAIYHCARDHKYWGINKKIFDQTVTEFIGELKFSETFRQKFLQIALEEWNKRQIGLLGDTINLNKRLTEVDAKIKAKMETIEKLTSVDTIQMFEANIEALKQERLALVQRRDNKEDEQVKIDTLVNHVRYYMEHLKELLLEGADPLKNAAMFGLIFEEAPTYEDLVNRTPKLAPLFALNQKIVSSQNQLVSPLGFTTRSSS